MLTMLAAGVVAYAADALIIGPDGATIIAKSINFGNRLGALLTLWNPDYVTGIQPSTFYQRSGKNFAWYKGGQHTDTELDPGGGSKMMSLTDGNLDVAGAATMTGLNVTGTATMTGLNVTGTATMTGLEVTGSSNSITGLKIPGNNALEFGAGMTKEISAGQIAYQKHSGNALDIVGAGTTAPERKISMWAEGGATLYGSLNVSGDVRSGARSLPAPGAEESLRIVRGTINPDGSKVQGEGFTIQKVDQGLYEIVFTPAFPFVPAASATQIFPNINANPGPTDDRGSSSQSDFANIAYLSPDRMRVKTAIPGGFSDRAFSFIVIGPR